VTAAALIRRMPEPGAIGGRQAASLIGVAPFVRDSGTLSGPRHIRGGRRRPRDVLYMAATTAMGWNPPTGKPYGGSPERERPAGSRPSRSCASWRFPLTPCCATDAGGAYGNGLWTAWGNPGKKLQGSPKKRAKTP